MNIHEMLNEHATGILNTVFIQKLRGVIAKWNEKTDTLQITYYFDGEPSEEVIEEAAVATTDIIAPLPISFIEEKFLRIDYPQPLPNSEFWVFRREE